MEYDDLRPDRIAIDFTVWSAVKLGAGFVIGASLVTLLVSALLVVLVAAGLRAW